jgi:hypothetical protein
MKNNRIILMIIISVGLLLTSCEKVIDLKLNTSSSAIIIQGNVFDHGGPYAVEISKTVNFTESNIFPPVTDAKVTISDNAGNSELLTQSTPGTYTTSYLRGIPGRTYTLNVENQGKTYTASTTMPDAVNIDSIYFKKDVFGSGNQTVLRFRDPANIDNYYRVIQYVNDTLKAGFYIGNDKLYQGEIITFSLSSTTLTGDDQLKTGARVKLQLECIDKDVFEYFRTSRGNNGSSASPANPVSNISNGALGYFSACSIREASITVP